MEAETAANRLGRLAGAWTLDPQQTEVRFRTKALWVVPVSGTARALSGGAQVGPDALSALGMRGRLYDALGLVCQGESVLEERSGALRLADSAR